MSDINLIVPPIFETQTTGFIIAAEKEIYRTVWRVEFWQGETFPRISKAGKPIASVAICPAYVARFANSIRQNFVEAIR